MAVEGGNEVDAEQPPQVDFVEIVQCSNTGNFDQCDLEEVADLVENIHDDNAPAPENMPTAVPTSTIFQG